MVANQQYHMIQNNTIFKLMEKISHMIKINQYIFIEHLLVDSGCIRCFKSMVTKFLSVITPFNIKSLADLKRSYCTFRICQAKDA